MNGVVKKVVVCLVLGLVGTVALGVIGRRKEPDVKERIEPRLLVDGLVLQKTNCVVSLTGYGALKSHEYIDVAPEVAGVVHEVHDALEVGGLVRKGEVLFRIDERSYQVQVDQARAQLAQCSNAVVRLMKERSGIEERLELEQRNVLLAEKEYERYRVLHEQHKVGSASSVDGSEQSLNQARTALEQVELEMETYEPRLRETVALCDGAKARLAAALLNLERCRLVAPYDCRISQCSVEKGQYADVGIVALQLADDSVFEVLVPLNGREAVRWVPRDDSGALKRVSCRIVWDASTVWTGLLDRVVDYQDGNRSLMVAVQLKAADVVGVKPLEGMFCTVEIPGNEVRDVIAVPRYTVSLDGFVCLADGERLTRRKVHTVWSDDYVSYVDQGLDVGEVLITTKLESPLEGSLLNIEHFQPKADPPVAETSNL